MLQKYSYVSPIDKTGVLWACIFQLYKGSSRKISFQSDFVKVSVRITEPENWLKKKSKIVSIIIRTRQIVCRLDGSNIKFFSNEVVFLKKRLTPMGGEISGCILKTLRRKKFAASFAGII